MICMRLGFVQLEFNNHRTAVSRHRFLERRLDDWRQRRVLGNPGTVRSGQNVKPAYTAYLRTCHRWRHGACGDCRSTQS